MSHVTRTDLVLVALMAMALGSCSSLRCGLTPPMGDPTLEVASSSGGVAPTFVLLRIYPSGLLEIEPVGLRRQCVRGDPRLLNEIRRELASETVSRAVASARSAPRGEGMPCCDAQFVTLRVDGAEIIVSSDEARPELSRLLQKTEEIFEDAFGWDLERRWEVQLDPVAF